MNRKEQEFDLTERLLDAWLHLSMDLWNERFVSTLSYNESLVCHLLYRKKVECPEMPYMTLMQLSKVTGILKSQMNKTLTSLEEKDCIERIRSEEDKRVVYISLRDDNLNLYRTQHDDICKVVNKVIQRLGVDRSEEAICIFNDIGAQISEILGKDNHEA